jgi:hypothetical protein
MYAYHKYILAYKEYVNAIVCPCTHAYSSSVCALQSACVYTHTHTSTCTHIHTMHLYPSLNIIVGAISLKHKHTQTSNPLHTTHGCHPQIRTTLCTHQERPWAQSPAWRAAMRPLPRGWRGREPQVIRSPWPWESARHASFQELRTWRLQECC